MSSSEIARNAVTSDWGLGPRPQRGAGQRPTVPCLRQHQPRLSLHPLDSVPDHPSGVNDTHRGIADPTDPHDTLNLGGEVVTYLGDEPYSITKSSTVWVPKGVPHNPQYFKRVDRPYYMIVFALCDNAKFFDYTFAPTPAPKTFKF